MVQFVKGLLTYIFSLEDECFQVCPFTSIHLRKKQKNVNDKRSGTKVKEKWMKNEDIDYRKEGRRIDVGKEGKGDWMWGSN